MFRRPLMRRRGMPLVRTVGRTAVIAGTATVVAKGVGGAMNRSAQQSAEAQAYEQEQQMAAMQAQQAAAAQAAAPQAPAPQAPAPQAAAGNPMMDQLNQLAQMKASGVLTDEEFAAAKAKLLGS